jgi:hypothetical protein
VLEYIYDSKGVENSIFFVFGGDEHLLNQPKVGRFSIDYSNFQEKIISMHGKQGKNKNKIK